MNSDHFSARAIKFAEPPHITEARITIEQIRAQADAERARWITIARRWDNAMLVVTFALLAMMAIRMGWAHHLGLLG